MGEPREPIDYRPVRRVTRLAAARIGTSSSVELAVELGLADRSALTPDIRARDKETARRVQRWLDGVNAPRFTEAMTMLECAGLLQPEAVAAWSDVSLEEARQLVEEKRLGAGDDAGDLAQEHVEDARARLEAREQSSTRQRRSGTDR